jgi:hypothetical protein
MEQHILLVSFTPPMPGTGTPIILQRHLLQLGRKGWRVSIVVPEQCLAADNKFPESWQIIPLAARRWWWPPLRPNIPGSLGMRLHLWTLACEQVLGADRPSAILTVLWGIYPLLAMRLSKRWNVPLSVLIHDQQEAWSRSKAERLCVNEHSLTVLDQSERIWPVSPELGGTYNIGNRHKIKVLLPIPERPHRDFVEWKPHFKINPIVAHAGSLHPFQLPNLRSLASALQQINGTLLLITPADNFVLATLQNCHLNVRHQEPFPHNKDVLRFLSENASCLLVSYSFEIAEQPWAATSFPSKLVEFSHLGLPILILAPPTAAISNWAKCRQWLSYISQLDESELSNVLRQLTVSETWLEMANQTRQAALGEFNPDRIQAQFEYELATVKPRTHH